MKKYFSKIYLLLAATAGLIPVMSGIANAADGTVQTARRIVKVGYYSFEGYHDIDNNGVRSGFGYEYIQNLLQFAPWKYEYSSAEKTWNEMLQMLENGEVDIVTGVRKTPEREMKFGFSATPLCETAAIMTVDAGNVKYKSGDYANWNGIRVGMLRGSTKNDAFAGFAAEKGFTFTPVYYDDLRKMTADLHARNAGVDAALTGDLRSTRGEWIYERFDAKPAYILVRKNDAALLTELNNAMEQLFELSPDISFRLRSKYFTGSSAEDISFSPDERRFIEQMKSGKHEFTAIMNPDRQPLSYYGKDKKMHGLLYDIAEEIIRRSGLNVRILPVKTRADYRNLRDNGKADLVFDSIDNYQLAENKNQILTNPFFTVTFSRLRNNLKTESANKAVALVRGSDIESAVRVLIPENAEIIPCESYEDAVQLVISGQCGSTFMLTRSAEYMASLSEYNTLVSEYMPSMAMKLSVAVDSGCDPMFVSIISKATGSINESFVDSLRTKYTFKQQMDYSFRQFVREHPLAFFGVPAVILLLISLLLTRILYMRRRDHKVAAAVRALPLRYFVINDSGEILLCGLGVGSEAFKDKPTTIDNLPDPAVVDIMRDKIGDVLRNGCAETVNFEFAGQKRSAIVSPLPEATFGQNVAIWVSQDTTELQNSKAEAKRNEEFFRLTLDSIGDGVIATDSDGKVMLLNPVAERMTGVSEEDAIGKPHENIFNIIGMLDGQPTPSPIRRAIRTGMIIELANHTDLVSKTGKRYNIADSAAPICDEYGKIIGAILVFRDVTDDYRRRSELNDALANWETASEMANIATYRMDMETRRIAPGTNAGKYWPVKDGKAAEIKDWIYEEDQAEVAAVSEQIKNGEIDNATFGFRAVKDGNMCYYRQFLRKDPHNRGYVTGLIQDITEVTNRQQQQNAMMSLWQQTIDTVPIMLFIKDPADNFRYIQCNSKFADLPGLTKEEVAGKTDDEIFGRPIDAANFNQWDRDIMNGGVSKEFYETAQGGDRIMHHFRTVKVPSKDINGNPILIGMSIDVTDLLALAQTREIISETFQLLFTAENTAEAIKTVLKKVGDYLGAARANVCRINHDEECIECLTETYPEGGEPLFNGKIPINPKSNPRWYKRLSEDSDGEFECDAGTEEGREITARNVPMLTDKLHELRVRTIHLNYITVNGNPWGNVGFITQRAPMRKLSETDKILLKMTAHTIELMIAKQMSRKELEKAAADAQAADKAKSFFLATMSHEIRTPLNAVIGFAELLSDSDMDKETQQEYIKNISFSGKALLQLINDVLDLSKLEAGQMPITKVRTDFTGFCGKIKSVFLHAANQKNLELTMECGIMPPLYIDQQRMRQVLFNLIGNAVKFTKTGGIKVKASFEKTTDTEGSLRITVSDTGIGISEEDQKTLFQPFVQASIARGTSAVNTGTGLGLAISRKLLLKMGGEITLKSKLGKGSVFTILIQNVKFEDSGTDNHGTEKIGTRVARPGNILLVDDSEMNRKVLTAMLKRLGLESVCAESGEEALKFLERGNFDMILTDLLMTGINGEEFAAKVRLNQDYGNIPIAAVTANCEKKSFPEGLFDKILRKPFTLEQLNSCIFGGK